MDDFGQAMDQETVRIERLLPGPIERLWLFLTDSEKRSKWLASGTMELRVGGKIRLDFLHSSLTPHEESAPERFRAMECGIGFDGTITECDPPRLLAYTWGGNSSEVKFELTEQGTKVLLVITHTRLRDRNEQILVASGWHTHLGILEDNLLEQTPRPFWATFQTVESEYVRRLAAPITVHVTRRFAQPPEKVFDAWLDPAIAARFLFATDTGQIVRCEIDPREGGKFTITDRRNGEEIEHTGEYLVIDRPRRLQFRFGVPKYSSETSLITIELERLEQGCELKLIAERVLAEFADRTRNGWTRILGSLAVQLESPTSTIHLTRFLHHPPAKVWRALTDPKIHARWWAAGDVKAEVGHRFTLDMGPWGHQPCEVIAVEPERLLRYSFALGTTITWHLEPEDSGTRLTLEHSGFDLNSPPAQGAFQGMSQGWPGVIERLQPVLESIDVPS